MVVTTEEEYAEIVRSLSKNQGRRASEQLAHPRTPRVQLPPG